MPTSEDVDPFDATFARDLEMALDFWAELEELDITTTAIDEAPWD